jgi:hypothetical protein
MSKHPDCLPGQPAPSERWVDCAADRSTGAAGRRCEETLFQTLCRLAADWAR